MQRFGRSQSSAKAIPGFGVLVHMAASTGQRRHRFTAGMLLALVTPDGMMANAIAVAVGARDPGAEVDVFVVLPCGRHPFANETCGVAIVAGIVRRLAHDVEKDLLLRIDPMLDVAGAGQPLAGLRTCCTRDPGSTGQLDCWW